MGNFNFIKTDFEGLYVVEGNIITDDRGCFAESYNQEAFHQGGITVSFVQDNESISKRGVLRGMHYQENYPQAKLVRVVNGEIFDVAVDLRPESVTYRKWYAIVLSSERPWQLYIPTRFAHGFLVLSAQAKVQYKSGALYDSNDERGIRWNDPQIAIEWPLDKVDELILSTKDSQWPLISSAT